MARAPDRRSRQETLFSGRRYPTRPPALSGPQAVVEGVSEADVVLGAGEAAAKGELAEQLVRE